jgi:hypothetical protein
MRKLYLIVFYLSIHFNLFGQITHTLVGHLGVTQTVYYSSIPQSKSYSSHFLPQFGLDYAKISDNLFWGGIGIGYNPRSMTLHKYNDGTKTGLKFPEVWFRVKAGLKFESDFLTHLPHISLGVSRTGSQTQFISSYNNPSTPYIYNVTDTTLKFKKIKPFIELGNTILNSSFRIDKRNLLMTFGVRYYPLSVFTDAMEFEYEDQLFKQIQYKIFEIYFTAGIQQNFQR